MEIMETELNVRINKYENCAVCCSRSSYKTILKSKRYPFLVPVYQCKVCNHHFSSGGPVNYDNSDLIPFYELYKEHIISRYKRLFRYIGSVVSPGELLDIGCGMGYSLNVAQNVGWEATGIEPNSTLAEFAVELGYNVRNTYLQDALFEPEKKFDVILIDNVLEHISLPVNFLKIASKYLKYSGYIIIVVPPIDWLRLAFSFSSVIRDHCSNAHLNMFLEVDEHLQFFTRKSMSLALKKAGLCLANLRYHQSLLFNNPIFRIVGLNDGYFFGRF